MSLTDNTSGVEEPKTSTSTATAINEQHVTYNDDPAKLAKLDPNITVVRKNGATYISPRVVDPSWIELKVGVLLPFHQQGNAWTRELTLSGTSAIRLAAREINSQRIIPGAYITLIEKDSYPKDVDGQEAITQAVFSTVSLIQEGVVGVIGDISSSWTSLSALMTSTLQIPQCSFTAAATSLSDKTQYGYFFRTVPTKLMFADAAFPFVTSQGWPRLGILYTSDDVGQQLSENLIVKSKANGINIRAYQKFYEDGPASDVAGAIKTLMESGVQIVFLAAEGEPQTTALALAASMGYVSNHTVWITIGAITNELYDAVQDLNHALQSSSAGSSNNRTTSNVSALQHAVQTTKNLNTLVDFNSTFAGGVFMFEPLLNLTGYPPYDAFQQKWSNLDPRAYPYGGRSGVESNQGMAYSCMMVMAYGFQQAVHNSTNTTLALQKLSKNKMGNQLQLSTFNTSFVGPSGPMIFDQNGDVMLASFSLYNIQNGNQVKIGKYIAGELTLTSPPIYHDGSSTPPSGVPTKVDLSARMDSPMSIVIACVAGLGTLLALVIMAIVIKYRKRNVFKASSPLFCVLELLGFILTYAAVLLFLAGRSKIGCILIPTTFHLGFSLVLSNLIAKNYRIYRIFNNIFVTRTVVTDWQLLKVSGSMALIESIILLVWLCTSDSTVITIPVTPTAFYVGCSFKGPASSVCSLLLTIMAAGQLAFATFLAIKTRSVGKSYSKYSEYKQIGISVYNIFFSALIGFVIFSVPATDYYTRHYLTATTVTWATTFSLLVLFLPKLHVFFFGRNGSDASGGKHSDLSGRIRKSNAFSVPSPVSNELISLNRMISNPNSIDPALAVNQNVSLPSAAQEEQSGRHPGGGAHAVLEAHEARMPVQVTFKYLPFLAAWDMKQVILFPSLGYFSFFSEKTQKGQVFSFTKATVVSATAEACIFRVHGTGLFDVLIQVANRQELEQWCARFNSAGDSPLASFLTCSNGGTTEIDSSSSSNTTGTRTLTTAHEPYPHPKQNSDSRRNLLRQESNVTLESIDNCIHQQPVVSASINDHRLPPPPPNPFFTSFAEFLDSDKPLQPDSSTFKS